MEASVDLYLAAESLTSGAADAAPHIDIDRRASRAAAPDGGAIAVDRKLGESLCEALIESGSLALAALDDGCISFASPAFLQLLGLASAEGETATSWCRRVHTADRKRISVLLADAVTAGHAVSTHCLIMEAAGGATRVHIAGYPAGPRSPSAYTLLLHVDVQSRPATPAPRLPAPVRKAFARVKNEVLDRTGELLVDAWLRSEALAILAVGLRPPASGWSAQARFDTEELLLQRLRPCLRDGDVLGRNGEDGLLIAIPNLSGASSAAIVAGRLIEAAGQGAPELNIGIALFPDDEQELSGLLAHARAALDIARHNGPNHYSLAETSLNRTMDPRLCGADEDPRSGHAGIDGLHAQLRDALREISRAIGSCSDLDAMHGALEAVMHAIEDDFRLEDELMRAHPGADAQAHRKDHQRVLHNLTLLSRADTRQCIALAAQFLAGWLPRHVREFDVPLVASTFRPLW